ncbi:MAG: NAD(P)(+) transhydrogenase (Re/Si-specific) subunit beta [Chitinophagaceae bacterium]
MNASILNIIYLIASVTFILGLKMLSHPLSARRGNLIAAAGMTLAIFGTIFLYKTHDGIFLGNKLFIFGALAIGTLAGFFAAKKVKMTAMPEMVSLFNGMGGACAMLISIIEFNNIIGHSYIFGTPFGNVLVFSEPVSRGEILVIVLGLIIGAVSFAGSIIAYGKLSGKIKDRVFKQQRIINFSLLSLLLIAAVTFIIFTPATLEHIKFLIQAKNFFTGGADVATADMSFFTITSSDGYHSDTGMLGIQIGFFYLLLIIALTYGMLFVMPIGGADMPVVISLLNSFTGVAAACGGFLYNNKAMLTGGILVGAAGTLLTILMCKAMNRSLLNVILGAFGAGNKAVAGNKEQGSYKEISISDSAMLMSYANKVMIVPGYGLAVAQAQHICHELEKILTEKGVDVKYAIHPVAGRMPGHMNVLLAEADVNYEKLMEMEHANDEFKTTDVVLILGANDVVNPAAKKDPASPIYGMPILEVEQAKNVIVNKRSMKPGYAGIENDLFFQPKTSMLFGDAKKVLQDLVAEIKSV